MKEYSFVVDEKYNNFKTIDFLKKIGISLEIIKKVKYGGVYVNYNLLLNINSMVKFNDVVRIVFPKDKENQIIRPQIGNLNVIYEDDYLLAVNKDKGFLTHSSKYNKAPSLDSLVVSYYSPNNFTFRAINRLDKDTSGIILIAKDMLSASVFGNMMKKSEFKKTYLAVVEGVPSKDHFIIDFPISRQIKTSVKREVSSDGKPAKTECFLKKVLGDDKSLLTIILHTGRTHQIRVHLSYVGLPLYGDALYNGNYTKSENDYILHNCEIEFVHPFLKKKITLKSPLISTDL